MSLFLAVDGVKGDSNASGFTGQIEVSSFTTGFTNTVTRSGAGGSGAGRPSIANLTITKQLDSTSTTFIKNLVSGKAFATATLSAVQTVRGASQRYLMIKVANVFVVESDQSSGGDVPTESIALAFDKITVTTYSTNASGTSTVSGTVTYDLTKGTVS